MASTLKELKRERKNALVNRLYNAWISDVSDAHDDKETVGGHGKRVPYAGWYWRTCDVVNRRITIARCEGGFIAVCENNKWGYPQRRMTPDEADQFIAFIDRAIVADRQGGQLSQTLANRNAILHELANWMQTLEVNDEDA